MAGARYWTYLIAENTDKNIAKQMSIYVTYNDLPKKQVAVKFGIRRYSHRASQCCREVAVKFGIQR